MVVRAANVVHYFLHIVVWVMRLGVGNEFPSQVSIEHASIYTVLDSSLNLLYSLISTQVTDNENNGTYY